MSVLAGFDLVVELNLKILEDKLRQFSFGGSHLDPPTEIVVGDTTNGIDAILLDPIGFALSVGSDGIKVTVPFDETTCYYNGTQVGPLKGNLEIDGFLDDFMVDSSTNLHDIGLFVRPDGVSIQWDPTPSSYTQKALAALLSSDRSGLEENIKKAIQSTISKNTPSANLNFNEDGQKNGLLGKSGLRFRSVLVQNIDPQTIGLFIMMLLASETPESVVRSEPGIPGNAGVAVSMSNATFQQLLFCPGATEGLVSKFNPSSQTPDQFAAIVHSGMPPSCGAVDHLPIQGGLELTYLQSIFQNGSVLVTGNAFRGKAGMYCFRVDAEFSTNLVLSVKNGAVQAVMQPNPPNISAWLDVSWYCFLLYFAAALVASPITALLAIWILLTAEWITHVFAPMFVSDPLNIQQSEQVGLAGMSLTSVTVLEERLTLMGHVPSSPPSESLVRSVSLAITDEDPGSQTEVGSGVYHFPGSKHCKAKDYHYEEYINEDTLTLVATPNLMGLGPSFSWTVDGISLTADSGDLSLQVPATIPQPGDLTLSLGTVSTTVSYQLTDPKTLVLKGHGQFNYSVQVEVKCKSSTNFLASDNLIATFTNHTIQMLDSFESDMAQCRLATKIDISLMRTIPQRVPLGDRGPDYGEVVNILRQAALQGQPGAVDAIMDSVRIYGNRVIDDLLGGKSLSEER